MQLNTYNRVLRELFVKKKDVSLYSADYIFLLHIFVLL